jgi:hypothetical protein
LCFPAREGPGFRVNYRKQTVDIFLSPAIEGKILETLELSVIPAERAELAAAHSVRLSKIVD